MHLAQGAKLTPLLINLRFNPTPGHPRKIVKLFMSWCRIDFCDRDSRSGQVYTPIAPRKAHIFGSSMYFTSTKTKQNQFYLLYVLLSSASSRNTHILPSRNDCCTKFPLSAMSACAIEEHSWPAYVALSAVITWALCRVFSRNLQKHEFNKRHKNSAQRSAE